MHQVLALEATRRDQRLVGVRALAAHLPPRVTLETFDFDFQPSLSARHIRELAGLSFLATCTSVVFLGPPGVGKTHLATALAWQALDANYSVRFATMARLLEDLDIARQRGDLSAGCGLIPVRSSWSWTRSATPISRPTGPAVFPARQCPLRAPQPDNQSRVLGMEPHL